MANKRRVGWRNATIGALTEKPKAASADDDFSEFDLGEDEEVAEPKTRRRKIPKTTRKPATEKRVAADKQSIDIGVECPVCRSLKRCGCDEHDRSFVRRTRFEVGAEKVARCNICLSPMSVVYIRRPGVDDPPYELSEFFASYCCATCSPGTLATVAMRSSR